MMRRSKTKKEKKGYCNFFSNVTSHTVWKRCIWYKLLIQTLEFLHNVVTHLTVLNFFTVVKFLQSIDNWHELDKIKT